MLPIFSPALLHRVGEERVGMAVTAVMGARQGVEAWAGVERGGTVEEAGVLAGAAIGQPVALLHPGQQPQGHSCSVQEQSCSAQKHSCL